MLKQNAEDGDIAEKRHLVQVPTGISRVNPANNRGVPVRHEQICGRTTLKDRGVASSTGSGKVRLVTRHVHLHRNRAIARHVRRDSQLELSLLKSGLNALRRNLRVRNHRSLRNRCLMVIKCQNPRRRHDAHNTVRLSRTETHVDIHVAGQAPKRKTKSTTCAGSRDRRQVHRIVWLRNGGNERREPLRRRLIIGGTTPQCQRSRENATRSDSRR